jgi:hypothetical protein
MDIQVYERAMVQRDRLGKAVSLAWNFPASTPRVSVLLPGIFGDD